MSPTKTTTRAIAASIALVAAGATVAGAAVFHLPILGFGRAAAASAGPPPVRRAAGRTPKVSPRVIVRTRYVDDIVHRPAPVHSGTTGAYSPGHRSYSAAPMPATEARPSVTVTRPAPAVAVTAPHARSGNYADEPEHEHDGTTVTTVAVGAAGSASSPAVDR